MDAFCLHVTNLYGQTMYILQIRKDEIGDGIEKLSGLSVGLFVGSIELSFWLFVGDIFAYLSGTLAKNVGAFVPSTEVADPRAANRETGYKVCF